MKIYIAGPMTGFDKFNFPMFDKWRDIYKEVGFEVFSPADHDRSLLNKGVEWVPTEKDATEGWKSWSVPNAPTLRDMLGADLAWIAANATHIAMLPGWENSKGANTEWHLAKTLGLEILYVD